MHTAEDLSLPACVRRRSPCALLCVRTRRAHANHAAHERMGARSPRGFKGRRISLAVATALHGRPLAAAPRLLPRARSSPHLLLGQAAAEAAPFASRAPAASALAAQLLWDLATLHTQAAAALFSLLCSARATRHVSYFLPPPRMVLTPVPPLAAPQPDTPASPDTGSSSSSELVSPGTNDRPPPRESRATPRRWLLFQLWLKQEMWERRRPCAASTSAPCPCSTCTGCGRKSPRRTHPRCAPAPRRKSVAKRGGTSKRREQCS